jgi:MYXO-CTERM domain-containing protein
MGPGDGSEVGHDFTMHVKAMGDCEVSKVEVSVAPQVLHAMSVTPPYDWDLTNISGKQTISVTATDTRGQTSTTTITVTAPVDGAPADGMGNTGCSVGGRGSSRGVVLFGVAAIGLVVRRRRR